MTAVDAGTGRTVPLFRASRADRVVLVAVTVAWASLYVFLGIRRLHGFAPRSVDLGFYVQMVRSLAHGGIPMGLANGARPLTLHVMPVLWPVAALARLVPVGELLVATHVVALALAIPAAFRLARWPGVIAVMLCPALGAQANFDVHPDAWSFAPLLLAIAYARDGRPRASLIAWCVAFSCRESLPLLGLAAAVAHFRADRRYALRLGALSLAWLGIALGVMFAFGSGPAASLRAHAGDGALVDRIASLQTFAALAAWVAAGGVIAILAPRIAFPAVVVFATSAASAVASARWVTSHYAAVAFPFLLAASLDVFDRVRGRIRAGAGVVLFGSLAAAYVVAGDGPLARRFVWDERPSAQVRAGIRRLAAIGDVSSVAATLPLHATFAARYDTFPDDPPRAGLSAVVLIPTVRDPDAERFRRRVAAWLDVDAALGPADVVGMAMRLARGTDRRALALRSGWITPTPVAPTRSSRGTDACVNFAVPVADAPSADVALAVRTSPSTIAIVPAGAPVWVPALSGPRDFVRASACNRPERIDGESLAWRWAVISPPRRPHLVGSWTPFRIAP